MSTSWIIDVSEEIKCPICLERMKKNQKSYPVNIMDCLDKVAKLNNPNIVDCPECQR